MLKLIECQLSSVRFGRVCWSLEIEEEQKQVLNDTTRVYIGNLDPRENERELEDKIFLSSVHFRYGKKYATMAEIKFGFGVFSERFAYLLTPYFRFRLPRIYERFAGCLHLQLRLNVECTISEDDKTLVSYVGFSVQHDNALAR